MASSFTGRPAYQPLTKRGRMSLKAQGLGILGNTTPAPTGVDPRLAELNAKTEEQLADLDAQIARIGSQSVGSPQPDSVAPISRVAAEPDLYSGDGGGAPHGAPSEGGNLVGSPAIGNYGYTPADAMSLVGTSLTGFGKGMIGSMLTGVPSGPLGAGKSLALAGLNIGKAAEANQAEAMENIDIGDELALAEHATLYGKDDSFINEPMKGSIDAEPHTPGWDLAIGSPGFDSDGNAVGEIGSQGYDAEGNAVGEANPGSAGSMSTGGSVGFGNGLSGSMSFDAGPSVGFSAGGPGGGK